MVLFNAPDSLDVYPRRQEYLIHSRKHVCADLKWIILRDRPAAMATARRNSDGSSRF